MSESAEPREAFCPVCRTNRPSLPAPAEGTCAYCFNHLMKPCQDCTHYDSGLFGDTAIGTSSCGGAPDKRKYDWRYARQNEGLCGPGGHWADFTGKTG